MQLSPFELDVLQVIWGREDSSAPRVHKIIAESRDVSYSTVKTVMDRLEQKGAIRRVGRSGRTVFYRATVRPGDARDSLVHHFVNRIFGGDPKPLLTHLLNDETLSKADIEYLEALVAKRLEPDEDES